jgi:hypothetical protein
MFHFFYNTLQPKFELVSVLMTDTDSYVVKIKKKEEDKEKSAMEILEPYIDFSNYPAEHSLYSSSRKNQLGYFKDELKGETMEEFIGLRSKTYAIQIKNKVHKRTKGVTRGYRNVIKFEDFKNCLNEVCTFQLSQYQIRSKDHIVTTRKLRKICFSSFDDKRYLLQCGIHSVPYGSFVIKKFKQICPFCSNLM